MNRGWLILGVLLFALFIVAIVGFKLLGIFLLIIFKYWYITLGVILVIFLIRLFRKRPEDKGIYRDSRGTYIETEYKVEDDGSPKKHKK